MARISKTAHFQAAYCGDCSDDCVMWLDGGGGIYAVNHAQKTFEHVVFIKVWNNILKNVVWIWMFKQQQKNNIPNNIEMFQLIPQRY
jgi:hypothetical protein